MIAPWITPEEMVDPTGPYALVDPDSPYAATAVESASYILWLLSARKFGGVRTTTEVYCQMGVREIGLEYPLTSTINPGYRGWQVWPVMIYGQVYNMIGGCCSTCGCTHLIRLRGGPIVSVDSVSVGDRQLTADEISVYDYSYVSAGDNHCWYSCKDVTVTYTYGAAPPAAGKFAAKSLADQYILALSGSDDCTLPERITQVTRQGMSWTLLDPMQFLDKGRTGIYQVDLFLSAVNPNGAQLRSRVFSPDVHRGKTPRTPPVAGLRVMGFGVGGPSTPSPQITPMQGGGTTDQGPQLSTMTFGPSSVVIDEGRPLRWVVPGSFTVDSPPVITVQPSGEEVPPDTLSWRTSNFTLDLTADQVATLLPPGSVLVVATQTDDGTTTGAVSYSTERRTP